MLSYDDNYKKWYIDYQAITNDDVLGYLTDDQVNTVLKYISEGKVHEHINIYDEEDA